MPLGPSAMAVDDGEPPAPLAGETLERGDLVRRVERRDLVRLRERRVVEDRAVLVVVCFEPVRVLVEQIVETVIALGIVVGPRCRDRQLLVERVVRECGDLVVMARR